MNDTPAMPSDRDLDALLFDIGGSIDVPPMADSIARARRRIEARAASERPHEPFTTLTSPPQDDRAAAFQPREILQLPLEEQDSKIREFALLAAGIAAAAILSVVLAFAFGGFDDEAPTEDGVSGLPDDHPLASEPFDLPGYEFVGAIGTPQVPNEPVDVAIGPDGAFYVLDLGLRRVVAFTVDGEIRTGWGDEGFSPRIPDTGGDGIGVGPDGQIYVALSGEVLVFDASGEQVDSWTFPDTATNETRNSRSQGLVVDSAGNVYVAGRGVIWRFESGTGATTTIEVDSETDFQLAIDDQDQLYAASWPGGIYRVGADGALEFLGRTEGREDINGLAIAPDGRFIIFRSSTGGDDPSTVIILDRDGSASTSWPIDRAGIFMSGFGPYWMGVNVTSDGTIVLPDPLGHRVAFFTTEGELVSAIRDERSDAFGRLWRISVDGEGNVLGYDPSVDPRVLRFAPDGQLLREMPFEAELLGEMGTLFDGNGFTATEDGGFVLAPQRLGSVSFYSPEGELVRQWEQMDLQSEEGLVLPSAVTIDEQGFVYIVDQGFAGRLFDNFRKFTTAGEFVAEVGSITNPTRADLVYHDGAIWAIDDGTILRFPADGGGPQTIATFETEDGDRELPGFPLTLALDPDGNILTYMFELDGEPGQLPGILAKLDPEGNVIWTVDLAQDAGNRYVDLTIADDGTLYLSDSELRQILIYRPTEESDDVESTPSDDDSGEASDRLLPVAEPPAVDGFEFTGYIGESTVPNEPSDAIGIDDGRIFVSDRAFDRIVAFTPDGDVDRSWGIGGFSARIPEPVRLAVDPDGMLWVATFRGEVFRLDDPANPELVWGLPDDGQVGGFVIDTSGGIYLANAGPGELVTPAEDGSATVLATIPRDTADLTIDGNDRLHLVDGLARVLIYDTSGAVVDRWTAIEGLARALSIGALPNGDLVVAQRNDDRDQGTEILTLSPDGGLRDSWQTDINRTYLSNVENSSIGVDADGRILIPDPLFQRVVIYDENGDSLGSLTADESSRFAQVNALATGPNGDLYAVDGLDRRAQRFAPDGDLVATYDFSDLGRRSATFEPHGIAVDGEGRVYVTTYTGQQVAIFAPDGTLLSAFHDPPRNDFADETALFLPYGVDTADDGTLLVADEGKGGDVKRFTPDGEFLDHWPTGESGSLYLRFEAHGDRVYISRKDGFDVFDLEGNVIAEIPYDGDVWDFDIDDAGKLYIVGMLPVDSSELLAYSYELAILGPTGEIIERIDLGLSSQVPSIAVSEDGQYLYIASGLSRQILAYERR